MCFQFSQRSPSVVLTALLAGLAGLAGCSAERSQPADHQRLDSRRTGETTSVTPAVDTETGTPESSIIADSIHKSTPPVSRTELSPGGAADADRDELLRVLARKGMEQQRTRDKKQLLEIQLVRERTANLLLTFELDAAQRYQVVRACLDAQLKLMGLGDRQAHARLRRFATARVNHQQSNIAQSANIALMASDLTARVKASTDSDLQPVLDQALVIIGRYPESYEVCRELLDMAEGMMQLDRRSEGTKLMAMLLDHYSDSQDERIGQIVGKLSHRLRVAELNFDSIMNAIRQQQPGAMDEYRVAVEQMVNSPSVDSRTAQEIARSLQWLEAHELYAATLQANQIAQASADQISDAEVRQGLIRYCDRQSTRLGWLNRPFQFDAVTARGQAVDWQEFHEKLLVVVFWSTSEPASMQALRNVSVYVSDQPDMPLALLGVNVASDLAPMQNLFGGQLPEWPIVVSDQPTGAGPFNELADRFGVVHVPFILLVDQQGNVVKINVDAKRLPQAVQSIIQR